MSDAMRASDSTPSAAEQWLQRHGDALYAFALARVFDRASAEDLVQDTLLAALRGQRRFRADSTERTWLIGILKHKCIDEIRRGRARHTPVNYTPTMSKPSYSDPMAAGANRPARGRTNRYNRFSAMPS